MLSLTVVKWLNRLPYTAIIVKNSSTCGTYFENHCIRGTAGLLVALVTVVLATSSCLPLWRCLQGLESGTCTDEEDGPRGRHDPCWFPHTGFEILCDEGLVAGSPPVIVLVGCSAPRKLHTWAGTCALRGRHLSIIHWAATEHHLSEFLGSPLLGLQAVSRNSMRGVTWHSSCF